MKLEDAMKQIDELTKKNEQLSSKIVDQAGLDMLVEDRMTLIDSCSKLVDGLDYKGKTNLELKKEVLKAKMPKVELGDKSDEYIQAAFDVLATAVVDTMEGKHDEEVYGTDLGDEKEPKVEEPSTEGEETIEVTKNVHEGENPDESEVDAEKDEEDATDVETTDSVSVLDSAFESEITQFNTSKELSPYQKYCEQSRNAWKKK